MDVRVIELYCKYIIKPLEEQKNQLERELLHVKFWNRSLKKRELALVNQLLNEKLRRLSDMIYEANKDE